MHESLSSNIFPSSQILLQVFNDIQVPGFFLASLPPKRERRQTHRSQLQHPRAIRSFRCWIYSRKVLVSRRAHGRLRADNFGEGERGIGGLGVWVHGEDVVRVWGGDNQSGV